jgi:hypothetical protein
LTVKAVDGKSAVERAIIVLEEHLTVLNAVCSDRYPSHLRVATDPEEYLTTRPYRVILAADPETPESGVKRSVTQIHLTRAMFEARMAQRGGQQISRWLTDLTNSFARRMLTAYLLAGTACTDTLPQRSFLLFAIALESVILGDATKTEITFRLSTYLANLLGGDLTEKIGPRRD